VFKRLARGVLIIDDYAHHPAEIRSTLQAARASYPDREIWAIYQPHTYSRTRTFLDLFNSAFNLADGLIVTDIYPARETPDPAITPELVAAASHHENGVAIHDLDDVAAYLLPRLAPGSLVIILSAGTATRLGPMLLEQLSDAGPESKRSADA
jgi:UDP-N-acetylmuramate--alanine ligase